LVVKKKNEHLTALCTNVLAGEFFGAPETQHGAAFIPGSPFRIAELTQDQR
jgi:hypothetical protein